MDKKEGEKEEKKGPQEREYNTKTPCQKLKRGKKTRKLTANTGTHARMTNTHELSRNQTLVAEGLRHK